MNAASVDTRRLGRRYRRREALLLTAALALTVGGHLLVQLVKSPTIPTGTMSLAATMAALYLVAHLAVRRLAPAASAVYLPLVGLLNGLGFTMVARLKPTLSVQQGTWIMVGVAAFCVTLAFLTDYRVLDRYRYTALAGGLVLLLLPLVPGVGRTINGSRLWIALGPVRFQPGEFAKILLVVFFASYLAERRELLAVAPRKVAGIGIPDVKHFGPMLLAWGMSMVVMMLEKDLGSSLLLFSIFLALLYIATGRVAYVVIGLALFAVGALVAYNLFGHVQVRVMGWLDPFNPKTVDPPPGSTGPSTYQNAQALFAMAAGGIFGTGLGLGRPLMIPEVATDFVFAAIGEELGFVGAAAVVLAYVALVANAFRTSLRCVDAFGKLLSAGLATAMGVQTFIIIGGVVGLIPLTGITLPFVSYGGSSIISNFVVLAILMAVSDQQLNGPRGHGLVRRKALPVGTLLPEAAAP